MSNLPSERVDLQVSGDGATVFPNAGNWQVGQLNIANSGAASPDLLTLLDPIIDASHTRDRRISPPNSACLPGTRKRVLQRIQSWMDSSVLLNNPHCMWVYGYAGCGKSAIAQEIAEYYSRKGRLVASFFFFRGSGDRSRTLRFARTVASQIAGTAPATAPLIRAAIAANPGLLTTATSLSAQFEHMIYRPMNAVKWAGMAAALRHGPFLIILDGLDECEDNEEITAFVQHMIDFFDKNPRTPLRILITSRVEGHIHQQLHSSKQVRLMNLVDHTSKADISTALDVAIADATRNRILTACGPDWLTPENRQKLIEHIGGSFIFMTTIIRFLFDMHSKDGLTPIERLPLALNMNPGFDGLYKSILRGPQAFPHFLDIVSSVALAQEPLSIAQIADLIDAKVVYVVNVLVKLHAIVQVPGDDFTPITLWHTSLRDFLTSEARSGIFHAGPKHHARLALRCIELAINPMSTPPSPAEEYAQRYAVVHWGESLGQVGDLLDGMVSVVGADLHGPLDPLQEGQLPDVQQTPGTVLRPSDYFAFVVLGIQRFIKFRDSDGTFSLLGRGPNVPDQIMLVFWPNLLAKAVQEDPFNPAFNYVNPTRVQITGVCTEEGWDDLTECSSTLSAAVAKVELARNIIYSDLGWETSSQATYDSVPMLLDWPNGGWIRSNNPGIRWAVTDVFKFRTHEAHSVTVYDVLDAIEEFLVHEGNPRPKVQVLNREPVGTPLVDGQSHETPDRDEAYSLLSRPAFGGAAECFTDAGVAGVGEGGS